jgi:hypothetical protein
MRAKQFILEYNISKTAEHFGSKLLDAAAKDISHEVLPIRKQLETDQKLTPAQEQQLIAALLKVLENADPTPNKKYMVWLAKMYATGGYQSNMEDMLSTVREMLAKFDKLNAKRMLPAPQNDIMKYSDIGKFLDTIETYPDPFQDKPEANKGNAKEFYEDNEIRVIVPEDMNAACYYGQGTRWCTAAKNNNMFKNYAGRGPLYIIIPKHPKLHAGEKYQFHFADEQYMDERDVPLDLEKMVELYPSIAKAFARQAEQFHIWQLMDADKQQAHTKQAEQFLFNIGKVEDDILTVNLSSDSADTGISWYRVRQVESFTHHDLHYGDFSAEGAIAVAVIDLRNIRQPVVVYTFGDAYNSGVGISGDLVDEDPDWKYASDEQEEAAARVQTALNDIFGAEDLDAREFAKGMYWFNKTYGEPEKDEDGAG